MHAIGDEIEGYYFIIGILVLKYAIKTIIFHARYLLLNHFKLMHLLRRNTSQQ